LSHQFDVYLPYTIDDRIAVSSQDPVIPAFYLVRFAKGRERKKLKLDKGKKRKWGMDKDALKRMREIEERIRGLQASTSRVRASESSESDRPCKKRRLSTDLRMATSHNHLLTAGGRSSRSRSKAALS
jgi:hypothetical protein